MTARSGPPSAKGDRRGTQRHIPVLLPEVLDALAPLGAGTFIDGTFGAGGYTSAILYAAPTARVLAIDRRCHDRPSLGDGGNLARLVH